MGKGMRSIVVTWLLVVAIEWGATLQAWSSSSILTRRRFRQRQCNHVGLNSVFDEHFGFDDEEHDAFIESGSPSDWITAEFTLLQSPEKPNPTLDALAVATTVVRSLQWVDYPTPNAGLERCFAFFSWECRKTVTARQGGDSLERFIEYGKRSPALQPFMGATRVHVGEGTYTPPPTPPHRGAMVSFPVVLHSAPIYALHHISGMNRTGVNRHLNDTWSSVSKSSGDHRCKVVGWCAKCWMYDTSSLAIWGMFTLEDSELGTVFLPL